MPDSMRDERLEKVVVLLATRNGASWIERQIDSVLAQSGVDVLLIISDDGSIDSTLTLIRSRLPDPRIELLPTGALSGSASGNFLRLFRHVSNMNAAPAAVALADQDDIWHPGKLKAALNALRERRLGAVSSSVTAFWDTGRIKPINKAQRQRRWDHVFESAGPGCTYVIRGDLAMAFGRSVAQDSRSRAVTFHDWLIYAWVRGQGQAWWIDPTSWMDYRQHDTNVLGANSGWAGVVRRLRMLFGGWYFEQVALLCDLCQIQAPFVDPLKRDRLSDRLALAAGVGQYRRKRTDQFVLATALLFGRRARR